ncbi:yqaJ domain-containing protein [Trichonephila clavipes]|nr:yqaJ domain-containing protein [Trichonephila clavipes]
MGPKKTLERIKYSFFWEGLRADVKKFCESCKKNVSSLDRLGLKTDHPVHLWQGLNCHLRWEYGSDRSIDPPSLKGYKYILQEAKLGQASSERWRYERSLRLIFFKEIACRKKSTPCSKLVMRIVYGRDLCNAAMKYGLANGRSLGTSMREYSTEVKICQWLICVDKDKPFLCASPDGLVGDDGLIENKCPYSADLNQICWNF